MTFVPIFPINWPTEDLDREDVTIFRQPRTTYSANHISTVLHQFKSVDFKEVAIGSYFFQRGVLFKKVSVKTAKLITDVDSTRSHYFHGRIRVVTYKNFDKSKRFTNFEALRGLLVITEEETVQSILVNELDRPGVKAPKPKPEPKEPKKNSTVQTVIHTNGTQEKLVKQVKESVDALTNYLNSRNNPDSLVHLNEGDFVMLEGIKHKVVKSKSLSAIRLVEGAEVPTPAILLAPYYD